MPNAYFIRGDKVQQFHNDDLWVCNHWMYVCFLNYYKGMGYRKTDDGTRWVASRCWYKGLEIKQSIEDIDTRMVPTVIRTLDLINQ